MFRTILVFLGCVLAGNFAGAEALPDLCRAVVITEAHAAGVASTPKEVLIEELEKRTGCRLAEAKSAGDEPVTVRLRTQKPRGGTLKAEGFSVAISHHNGKDQVTITGAGARGLLFGVGHLLRHVDWSPGKAVLLPGVETVSSPEYPIRGHQLGYRAAANSWDKWGREQMEQYIRDLAIFGINCIENIPFQDDRVSPHMPISRDAMNKAMSEICVKYDLDYWVWTPADFDLKNPEQRAAALAKHEAFYAECPRLDAVFFPGGDPGDNHPAEVMPFLEDISKLLTKHHPGAEIWMSLQGFSEEQVDYFYQWMEEHHPAWFTGVVAGPSSPPIDVTRQRLAKEYGLRHYPDITHNVRCQYPLLWWDQAYALTLGREAVNPTPCLQGLIHNTYAPDTDGFLAYSDGVHDDLNKAIWSRRAWNPKAPIRNLVLGYTRYFFGGQAAEASADGILALEKNWEGPLITNGGVDATLGLWQDLTAAQPELLDNWRWQMYLMRANYDAYTRHRLIYEQGLETEANALLDPKRSESPAAAMDAALAKVLMADSKKVRPELRQQVVDLSERLFQSIGLQTSVEKYQASGAERGATLDFLDYPLNNRWWLEDEFKKVRELPTEAEQWSRLQQIRTWSNPGPGSFYDDIGNVANAPHTIRGEALNSNPVYTTGNVPTYWWWDGGMSRARLSWQVSQDWPDALQYDGLDPNATYVLRMTGYGDAKPRADKEPLSPTLYGKGIGEIKEFPVPPTLYADRKLRVTFDIIPEPGINWRQMSRVAEVWLIKQH